MTFVNLSDGVEMATESDNLIRVMLFSKIANRCVFVYTSVSFFEMCSRREEYIPP